MGRLTELQFVDNAATLAETHAGAEKALASFRAVASCFGLTVNTAKTKFMPIGHGVCPADLVSLNFSPGTVECEESFRYLGCQVTPDARSALDGSRRVAAASGVFYVLNDVVFGSADFTLNTKRCVYSVTVLAVLLYRSECWTLRQRDFQCLETFHHHTFAPFLVLTINAK